MADMVKPVPPLPEVESGYDARGPLLTVSALEHDATSVADALMIAGAAPGTAVWIDGPTNDIDAALGHLGLSPDRDLLRMDVRLPLSADIIADTAVVPTRTFVVGQDEHAWVEVNNRAFDWHREQGGWTVERVRQHQTEPWFSAEGFLLHDIDGELAGFCWTKIHDELDPVTGEIYVIGVDPRHHGKRLGQAMTVAGLASIHDRGIDHAMLYVDADNTAAVRLYEKLGFATGLVRRLYI